VDPPPFLKKIFGGWDGGQPAPPLLHEQFSSPPGIKQHIVQSEAKTIFQLTGTIDHFRVPLDIAVERLRMKPRQQDILLAVGGFEDLQENLSRASALVVNGDKIPT